MNLDRVASIFGAIVTVALVTTVVAHRNTASVVTALGRAFSGSIRAAMGK